MDVFSTTTSLLLALFNFTKRIMQRIFRHYEGFHFIKKHLFHISYTSITHRHVPHGLLHITVLETKQQHLAFFVKNGIKRNDGREKRSKVLGYRLLDAIWVKSFLERQWRSRLLRCKDKTFQECWRIRHSWNAGKKIRDAKKEISFKTEENGIHRVKIKNFWQLLKLKFLITYSSSVINHPLHVNPSLYIADPPLHALIHQCTLYIYSSSLHVNPILFIVNPPLHIVSPPMHILNPSLHTENPPLQAIIHHFML